jgi:hypothetical protein
MSGAAGESGAPQHMHTFPFEARRARERQQPYRATDSEEDDMATVTEGGRIQGSSYMDKPSQQATEGPPSGAAAKATDIAQAGKEKVKELGGVVRGRALGRVDARKHEVVEGLHSLADTLEKASRDIPSGMARGVLDGAVGLIHKATDRIENGTSEELLREAQERVRQSPGAFIAGSVALGFFAGRFLKI